MSEQKAKKIENKEISKYKNLQDRLEKDIEQTTKYTENRQLFFLDMFYHNSQESVDDLISMYEQFAKSILDISAKYEEKLYLLEKAKNGTDEDYLKARKVILEDANKFKEMVDLPNLIETLKKAISLTSLHIQNIQETQANNVVLRTKKRFDGYIEHLNKALLTDTETLKRMEDVQKSDRSINEIEPITILTQITDFMKTDLNKMVKSMEMLKDAILGEYKIMKQVIADTDEFKLTEAKLVKLGLIETNKN